MKKTMLLLVTVLMFGLMSCSKDDNNTEKVLSTVKQSWILTIKTTITNQGVSASDVTTKDVDNMTEAEVFAYAKTLEKTTQTEAGGTMRITVTYATKVLSTVKQSWVLTITVTTSYSPAMPGVSNSTINTTIEKNNMTEAEVIAYAKTLEHTTEIPSAGYIMTMKTTVTYAPKK